MHGTLARRAAALAGAVLAILTGAGCFDHGGSTMRYADVTGASASGKSVSGSRIADAVARKRTLSKEFPLAGTMLDSRSAAYAVDAGGIHIESLRVTNARHRASATTSAAFYVRNDGDRVAYVVPERVALKTPSGKTNIYRMEITRAEKDSVTLAYGANGGARLDYIDPLSGKLTTETGAPEGASPAHWNSHLELPAHHGAIVAVVFSDQAVDDGVVLLGFDVEGAPLDTEFAFRRNGVKLP